MTHATSDAWTIGQLVRWTEQFFRGKNFPSPRLDAQVLLAHCLKCEKTQLYVRFDEVVNDLVRADFREMVRRRSTSEPVAYLVGHKEFFLLDFEVTRDVLIPRPATESLVMSVLDRLKGRDSPTLLDLGCGSGCVGISVAVHNKAAAVSMSDISSEALAISQRNATRHGVTDRSKFIQSDIIDSIHANELFDVIASNPPYVSSAEYSQLSPEVREFEPRLALDGGNDGYTVIDKIIREAPKRLANGGWLMLEVGYDQAEHVRLKMLASKLSETRIVKDRDGVPRIVAGRNMP